MLQRDCLVVAIVETFPVDVPAGAHEGVVVPLGAIPLRFQTSSSFMRNSVMEAVFLITRSSPTSLVFLLLFFHFPSSLGLGVGLGIRFL
jgi:hypothetical protein